MSERRRALLVLGASLYQLPVIERAKARGYRVITTDNVPNNPGHALGDVAHGVDTTHGDAVLALAREERIDGVIAACTDVAVPTAALVASQLGLRGPPCEAAAILCDKIRFRVWLAETRRPVPRHFVVEPGDVDPWPGHGAWVIKPDRSSGSKGVFVVCSAEELALRLPETHRYGRRAIIEEFLEGEQLTCEGLLREGRLLRAWITRRETAPLPYVATWGHSLPSGLPGDVEARVRDAVVDLLRALAVSDGPFDADVVWVPKEGQCYVLEATPRLGGNSLSRLIELASSYDLVGEAVACACGEEFGVDVPSALHPSAVVLLGVMTSGRLKWREGAVESLRQEPWVRALVLDRDIGDSVKPFIDGRSRIGEALIQADDPRTLERRYHEVRQRLALSTEAHC